MKPRQKLLTDEQWELIEPFFPNRGDGATNVDGHQQRTEDVSRVFCQLCKPAPPGDFCRTNFLPLDLLAAVATLGGRVLLAGSVACPAGGTGRKRSAALGRDLSRRQFRSCKKRGLAVGKTKRGKGTKWMVLADGEGIPLGVRLESASPAEVTLAEATLAEVRVPRATGPTATKSGAGDCRPRLRFRSAASATEEARHRTDCALPQEQPGEALRRWTQTAALQAPLDRGANQCVARTIPPLAGAS